MSSRLIRREIVFHGQVQGVGFRWTTASLAEAEDLAGWVRNEPDGTVRMVVEGAVSAIEGLLVSIEGRQADVEVAGNNSWGNHVTATFTLELPS